MVSTLVVGLDAATWEQIDPLLEAGRLDNIGALLDDGTSGHLRSTLPPLTPLAWTTIATGVNPGEHGVYDFRDQNTETYEVGTVDYSSLSQPTVWDIFEDAGLSAGVINFPMAYPPSDSTEFFVSGFPSSADERIATPQRLQSRIEDSDYRVEPDESPSAGPARYLAELLDVVDVRTSLTCDLVERHDPDLVWTVFMATDWAQHYLFDDVVEGQSAVETVYEAIDEAIGRLLDAVGPGTNVVLVSDHGCRRIDGEIHLNSLLEEWGYLRRVETDTGPAGRAADTLGTLVRSVGSQLPYTVRQKAIDVLPSRTLDALDGEDWRGQQETLHVDVDWTETTAFSYGVMGQVYVHRADRYPEGTVSAEEYEAIREDLRRRLVDLTHPDTGAKLVEDVVPGEKLFHGASDQAAPDLVVVPADWRYVFYGDFGTPWIHDPEQRQADHDPHGIVVFSGPDAGRSTDRLTVDATDVAPTLLALHGLPLPENIAGRIVPELLATDPTPLETVDPDTIDASHVRSGVGDEEDREVERRLQELGYL